MKSPLKVFTNISTAIFQAIVVLAFSVGCVVVWAATVLFEAVPDRFWAWLFGEKKVT